MKNIRLPEKVQFILETFRRGGFEAYIVGGCVRDSLMGRTQVDWDIATNALPDRIKALFERTIDTGIKHGTVTIMISGDTFETTTYRVDGRYTDNRRPENVTFTSSITEDLSRRDFTVNAMAYNPAEDIIDPFGGIADIKNKLIRTVGNADERFHEDALRMLRAVRFSAQLGYRIDAAVLESIQRNSLLISHISFERIRGELNGILLSDRPEAFELLRGTALLHHISPQLDNAMGAKPDKNSEGRLTGRDIWETIKATEKEIWLRWAILLGSLDMIGGEPAAALLRKLRFDNRSINSISLLIRYIDMEITPELKAVLRALSLTGKELFTDLLKLKGAWTVSAKDTENIRKIKELYQEIIENNYCYSLEGLAVNGGDITALGVPPGKAVGDILKKLLDIVLDNPGLNTKASLVEAAKGLVEEGRDKCF